MPELPSKTQRRCRICGHSGLLPYLDLGSTPLANSYLRKDDLRKPELQEKLTLQLCSRCGLSQLTRVVHPDRMFKNYLYVSSTTETFRSHCGELARTAVGLTGSGPGDLAVDIASNDGCLLARFKELGLEVAGVEPAENLAPEAEARGIPTLCAYWSRRTAESLLKRFGPAKVITSTNVFAHVDDVHAFAEAVTLCLAPRGIWVIEVPYILDFIGKNEFDTAYHEHLSYLGVHPLSELMARHGLSLFDVHYFPRIHGGTIRALASRRGDYPRHRRVAAFLKKEREFGIKKPAVYRAFARRVLANREALRALLGRLRREGRTIWAYGASAKGNTLMNFFGATAEAVPVVIDDNPKKWGYYTPGAHMRIAGIRELARSEADYLLLLAWNFKDEILRRCRAADYEGKYILPVPQVRVLDANPAKAAAAR